jgi:hypothetical protein
MGSEGHGKREEPGEAALKNSPAYGERDVVKVDDGTGEVSFGRWTTATEIADIS